MSLPRGKVRQRAFEFCDVRETLVDVAPKVLDPVRRAVKPHIPLVLARENFGDFDGIRAVRAPRGTHRAHAHGAIGVDLIHRRPYIAGKQTERIALNLYPRFAVLVRLPAERFFFQFSGGHGAPENLFELGKVPIANAADKVVSDAKIVVEQQKFRAYIRESRDKLGNIAAEILVERAIRFAALRAVDTFYKRIVAAVRGAAVDEVHAVSDSRAYPHGARKTAGGIKVDTFFYFFRFAFRFLAVELAIDHE